MSYIELYGDEILEAVNLGKTESDFNEDNGDYIKVEVFRADFDIMLAAFYSNKLLLKYPSSDEYYIGDYHYHPENEMMGFCTGRQHSELSISGLKLISEDDMENPIFNLNTIYKKQVEVFRSSNNDIYFKLNEIFKLIKLNKAKYKVKIHFLRNIKSTLGNFLKLNENNLIENGNFFAGLEATQTGDLDRSVGRNNFLLQRNPGFSNYVLEQDGLPNNKYDMRVTGIKPTTNYIFSCWVTWNNDYYGNRQLVKFSNAGPAGSIIDPLSIDNQDENGSWFSGDTRRDISTVSTGGLLWYHRFVKVATTELANIGTMRIRIGESTSFIDNPYGRRYFTDLRFVEVENFESSMIEYLDKLKLENN